jgi:hypothetical protein
MRHRSLNLAAVNKLFYVPVDEDVHFRGRDSFVQDIHDSLWKSAQHQNRVVIHGLSGIGKSALVAKYAFLFRREYEGVFWVSFASQYSMETGYRNVDQYVKQTTQSNLEEWLSHSTRQRWLFIADGFDAPETLSPARNVGAQTFFPHGCGGHILITTQRRTLNEYGELIALPALEAEQACEMLLTQSRGRQESPRDRDLSLMIVSRLLYVPLAIKQCASDVAAGEDSLENYCLPFDELMSRINIPDEDNHMGDQTEARSLYDMKTRKTVLTTWEVSFQHLQERNSDAATLLSIFGFMDPSDISEELLDAGLHAQKRWDRDGNASVEFMEGAPDFIGALGSRRAGKGLSVAINDLLSRSLIFRKRGKGHFFLHPVSLKSMYGVWF